MKNSEKELLLVEDEALIAIQQKKNLENYGYRVHHVYNANEAVKAALDPKSGFDLILMDIDLGSGMDGTEAAERILKQKEIPLIFVSSHTEAELVEKTSKITSYGYVVKDSGIAILELSIRMALRLFDAKKQIAQSEERHRQLFETMSPGVVYHSSDGTIISANPAAEKILGLTIDQMNGKTAMDPRWKMIDEQGNYVPGSNHPAMITLRTGKKTGPVDRAVFVPEQDRYIWLTITATPLFNNVESKPFEVYATFDDITRRKKAEQELQERNKELDATNEELNVALEELQATNEQLISSQEELIAREKIITQSDDRFKTMLQLVPDMISIQDADMNILYSNWRGFANVPESLRLINSKCHKTYRDLNEICPDCLAASVLETGKIICKESRLPDGRWFEIHAIPLLDENNKVTMFMEWVRDITENKQAQLKMSEYEWIKEKSEPHTSQMSTQPYGDITKYNTSRLILDSVGKENLEQMAEDVMSLLDTSIAVYESNGDYAYGMVESGWCRFMDSASFNLCGTNNFKEALNSRKWLCHESCWQNASLQALESGKPVDINCAGGINLYAVPIMTHDKVAGVVSIGYGNPPKDYNTLKDLSEKYNVCFEDIKNRADNYKARPDFIIELGKKRCVFMSRLIGEIIERKKAEDEIKRQLSAKETLLKEVHHRIKNSITQVEGLLALQADSTGNDNVKDALNEAISRVRSIRTLYEKLLIGKGYKSVSIKNYIESLVESLESIYSYKQTIKIEKKISDFELNSKTAIPVGIIINELMTNIFKYAFKKNSGNHVLIEISKTGNVVSIIVQDNGVGITERRRLNDTPGFGLTIINMLTEQLGGTYTFESQNGTKFIIEFEYE